MQIRKNNEVIMARDKVFNYAHKYYNFTLEQDYYLNFLVHNLLEIFKSKVGNTSKLDIFLNEDNNILDYRFTENDIKDFNNFYLDCIHFDADFNINLLDDKIYLNKFGKIILTNNPDFKGKTVFELNMNEFNPVLIGIKHNIFVSKLYQYLSLLIKEELGSNAYDIFKLANGHIITYENTLLKKMKTLEFKTNSLSRVLK